MKRTAIILDGAFVNKKIKIVSDPVKQAVRVLKIAHRALAEGEDLLRIFYYDCPPYGGTKPDPFGVPHDFSQTDKYAHQTKMLAYLKNQAFTAVRLGEISYEGWKLLPHMHRKLAKKAGPFVFTSADFMPDFSQKGVDMRIGLDVATLAIGKLVERIIMITADSDFIPAMKLARREGVQVVLCMLGNAAKPNFAGHADMYRNPSYQDI